MMRMSVDLVGREKCFERFFGVKRFSKNFEEASPTVSFLSQKNKTIEHISYIKSSLVDHAKMQKTNLSPFSHVTNSALEVAKLASLSKSYKEPKGGEDESLTYLEPGSSRFGRFFWGEFRQTFYTQS